jgi:hypothetical protein
LQADEQLVAQRVAPQGGAGAGLEPSLPPVAGAQLRDGLLGQLAVGAPPVGALPVGEPPTVR